MILAIILHLGNVDFGKTEVHVILKIQWSQICTSLCSTCHYLSCIQYVRVRVIFSLVEWNEISEKYLSHMPLGPEYGLCDLHMYGAGSLFFVAPAAIADFQVHPLGGFKFLYSTSIMYKPWIFFVICGL